MGNNISYLMDRKTVNIASAQVGFIDLFVIQAWETLEVVLPAVRVNIENAKSNKDMWKSLVEKFDKDLKR